MGWFNKKKETVVVVQSQQQPNPYQAFSTPFGQVGKGNLSLPYISDAYRGAGGYVRFGQDNLFPQLLTQLYFTSALHSSICNFTVRATVGGGYEYGLKNKSAADKMAYFEFDRKIGGQRGVDALMLDLKTHERVYFRIKNGKVHKRISPDKVRANPDKSLYYVSDDWSRQTAKEYLKPYHPANDKSKDQIYCYERESLGQDVYPIPPYASAANWIYLDGEMSFLHKSNIMNSINPAFAIMFPKKIAEGEEKDAITAAVNNLKGAGNAGKTAIFTANDKDLLPQLVPIPTSQNDKLLNQTDEQVNLKICQAHTIDPMLMGVRVSGKLGGGTDIENSYIIFEKNTILPMRNEGEMIVNDLLTIDGLNRTFTVNNFQIIHDVIKEVGDNNAAPATSEETKMESNTNDSLKGLTAAENMDIMRIIRDHGKGRLNDIMALTRLKAYGISEETAKEILGL